MHNVDVEKIMALRKAGWRTERIAAEMHMEPDEVDKAISGQKPEKKEAERKKDRNADEKEKDETLFLVTSEQMKEIYEKAAAIGAKEALKIFEQERKKE